MSDTFTTDRGTTFKRVSEDYVSYFTYEDMVKAGGLFFNHYLGMCRFLGVDTNLRVVTERTLEGIEAARQKRADAIAQADAEFMEDMVAMLQSVLPYDDGNSRSPKILKVTLDGVDVAYSTREHREEPTVVTAEHNNNNDGEEG